MSLIIRPAVPSELPYVAQTWLRSSCPDTEALVRKEAARRIAELMRDGTIRVAVDSAFPLAVAGWECHQGPTLRYVYVRNGCRRQGVGAALLAGLDLTRSEAA